MLLGDNRCFIRQSGFVFRSVASASAAVVVTSTAYAIVVASAAGVVASAAVAAVEKKNSGDDNEPSGGIFKEIAKAVHTRILLYFIISGFCFTSASILSGKRSFVYPSLYYSMRRCQKRSAVFVSLYFSSRLSESRKSCAIAVSDIGISTDAPHFSQKTRKTSSRISN